MQHAFMLMWKPVRLSLYGVIAQSQTLDEKKPWWVLVPSGWWRVFWGYLLLIVTAQQMLPCAAYRTELRTGDSETDNFQMARIIGPLLIANVIWLLRALELALGSKSECARRQSSQPPSSASRSFSPI